MSIAAAKTDAEQALGASLPHRRLEEWRWTDLRRLITKPYGKRPSGKIDAAQIAQILARAPFAAKNFRRITMVDGVYQPSLSRIDGLDVKAVTEGARVQGDIAALGFGLEPQGVHLTLSGAVIQPVEIIHISTADEPRALAVNNRVTVTQGAAAAVIETFVGEGDYLLVSTLDIELEEGAKLDRLKLELEAPQAIHLGAVNISIGKSARLRDFTLTLGAKLNRQNGTITFTGEEAEALVSGAYLLARDQHADTRLIVDHAVPRCLSRELFKCVMDDRARGIFQGKVIVRPHAQKTDGKQSSHALLLSPQAEFDAKPELEIFADDVVCGHGATCGDINHDHLFYLKSRGIPEAEARRLLILAFLGEALDQITGDDMRDVLEALVAEKLASNPHA